MKADEIWKPIKGYEGLYEVSNLGRVKSLDKIVNCKLKNKRNRLIKGRILKSNPDKMGYLIVGLTKNNKTETKRIHRLVAETFMPVVNHIDGNKENNNIENLEFCSQRYNVKEAFRNGLAKGKRGKENSNSKPVEQYDLNGKLIKKWESIMDIQRELGYSNSTICKCCMGKLKKSYGYIWKYSKQSSN